MIFLPGDKQKVVAMFVGGKTMLEISALYGVHRQTIEAVIREGMEGLVKLNAMLTVKPDEAPVV